MANVDAVQKLCQQFKSAFDSKKYDDCSSMLPQLKIALTGFTALPPFLVSTPTAQQELLLGREILEHAVLLSVYKQDEAGFERNHLQLKPYYTDARSLLPQSQREYEIVGLNLLRLLAQNRIAEFHTELETIPVEVQNNVYIKYAVQLEQWLMEGAYNKLRGANSTAPVPSYGYFVNQLSTTVREEIASCSERAYQRLTLQEAMKVMNFASQQELLEFCAQQEWKVDNGVIHFNKDADTVQKDVPTLQIIQNMILYAQELDRIV